jgi:hypothetical protein
MSYYEGDEPSYQEEIEGLMSDVQNIVSTAMDEDYFGVEEYEKIQIRMKDLLEQGVFWLQREDPKRFIYDIKDFLKWICDFVEHKERQDKEDEF